ncbi:hypothetical protein [Kribbella sp. NPDC004875]|uniref:hypothetical protein n=1 Tax=Kribbella sp. NPDC004875 TaxID=3364107 RepID=UPI0036C1AF4E
MNDLLKDTLTRQAESTEAPPLDLEALIGAGRRRTRRRTVTKALAGTFAALAVVAAGTVAVRAFDNEPATAGRSTAAYTERRPTYAVGNVIHYGDEQIQAAGKVSAMVQTDAGLIYASGADGKPGNVTLLDSRGRTVISGPTEYPRLMSDGHSVIAWFEDATKAQPYGSFVVYDVANHRQLRRLPIDATTMNGLAALDRGYAYVWVGKRLDRIDLRTGRRTQVRNLEGRSIVDISGPNYLYTRPAGAAWALYLGNLLGQGDRDMRLAGASGVATWIGGFAPDGKHAVIGADDDGSPVGRLQVTTTPVDKHLFLRLSDYPWQRFAGWLDNDHFTMAAAMDRKSPADLLTCSISSRNCKVTARGIAPSLFRNGIVYLTR